MGQIRERSPNQLTNLRHTVMEELIRNLKNDVGGGTPKPVSKASYSTSASVQDKKVKEGRGRETGDYAMNIGGYSFPFSELQGLEGRAVDLKPFPTPFELGMNQSLHYIFGNIRHGCARHLNAAIVILVYTQSSTRIHTNTRDYISVLW